MISLLVAVMQIESAFVGGWFSANVIDISLFCRSLINRHLIFHRLLFCHFSRIFTTHRIRILYINNISFVNIQKIFDFSVFPFPILMMEPEERYQSLYVSRYCSRGPLVKLFSERNKTILWRQLWIWLAESELELGLKQVFWNHFVLLVLPNCIRESENNNIATDYDSLQRRTWVWNWRYLICHGNLIIVNQSYETWRIVSRSMLFSSVQNSKKIG